VALLALLALFASHNTHAQQQSADGVGTVTEPLGESYDEPKKLAPNVARVTFYRPAHGYPSGVASLQVNDHYHVSLQFGGYSELCLPPGRISLAAHMVQTGAPLKNYKDATAALPIQGGNNVYFRINEFGDNRATITPVRADVALPELKNTRRQAHVVSRVPNAVDCLPREPSIVKKESIVLGADALFAFGKSDIKGISPQGRASLDELVAHLQKEYATQEGLQIQVTGHADPLGNPASNKRLSEARAKAIRTYMVGGGLKAQAVTAVGAGSEQPVITTCGKTATPEAIECNKPNRRVVVNVQATAR
jgi:outer membrane protein OmpA-like peptidoglycan-associated protein